MADRGGSRRGSAHDLGASSPDRIRNVVLVGPAGSGKTTLAEALLAASGAITRAGSVRDGTTVCDFEESEHVHGRTISLAVAPLVHAGVKVNLVDTPGYADFVGELRAGLRAADCALFVVAANEGVDDATRALWRECAAVGMPRAVVVAKLDQARADYDGVLRQARAAFGDRVLPLYVPLRSGSEVTGLTGLLAPGAEAEATGLRGDLIEAVIEESEDETLMDRYVGGEEIDEDVLVADLERAVARATFFPVVPVCSTTGVGCTELLDLAVRGFPSPVEHPSPDVFLPSGAETAPITGDPGGPLVAEVVKTTSDPYVGRLSLVRVFSGTLVPDQTLHVSGHFTSFFGAGAGHQDHDEDERIGALAHPFGRAQAPTDRVVAGDLCAIGRLTRAETGDTLSSVEEPRVLRPWSMPEPLLPIAIVAHSKADEDKLSQALSRLGAEDPSLRIENNPETHQLVLWCMGESHAEVTLERLTDRYSVHVDQVPFVVPLRETFAASAKGLGRHVKQSGGHGQYAVCHLEIEPLEEGAGFEFVDQVVGGSVPRQFIPSVEKGVRAQMERGCRHGHPMVDLRVTLVDGKAHSVDSSDMAFQTAGALALREAAAATTITMLEPFDTVAVVVPDELVGSVMSDLSARRARLLGTDKAGDDRTQVLAEVPQTELVRYAVDLRASTHGSGVFTRSFAHYEAMPEDVARVVLERA
ncbi:MULTISPECIES: elongation factor G-like protein EF-G2 [unclassified Nocardioides]|uniref:elongation factor G-like protein EF-G2 n=1 Tax=unclassified Nocardioides TaxID=2615069 RepID=UPI0009F11DED|nr:MULTISPECIES: elongation factor G-like protein EF-G2 [unclassified Nocardioides]GAW49796.1 elongation factor G [Nocardioides sp. PD653-B2]GAW57162.1 elongation factor G [Nocardioides sp. PD653]